MNKYKLNENEKKFVELLDGAWRCVKGDLELDNFEGEWFAMDYREELGGAFGISIEPYDKPLITEEEAERQNIDVEKCCGYVCAYIVG